MPEIVIRDELETDHAAIRALTELAFRHMPYAGGDEQDVIERLRTAGALSLSCVAVQGQEIVGHIAFSPAQVADGSGPWFALGPVSVSPANQRQGTGSALIEHGLARLNALNALGCILTGNPDYYRRFGFRAAPENCPENEPAQFFMLKLLRSIEPSGRFSFHQAFYSEA
jgi:putative acetyltransferase